METNVPAEEKELLERARKFEHQALAYIYDQYSNALYRYAMRSLGDPIQAEECVAETFSRFLQAMRKGKGPREYLMAYLYQIAHNWIADQYRRMPVEGELEEDFPGPRVGVADEVEKKLSEQRLRRAINKLTIEQQQVIIMKYMEGFDNSEIARILRKPIGAIKSLQHRALASLHRFLQEKI